MNVNAFWCDTPPALQIATRHRPDYLENISCFIFMAGLIAILIRSKIRCNADSGPDGPCLMSALRWPESRCSTRDYSLDFRWTHGRRVFDLGWETGGSATLRIVGSWMHSEILPFNWRGRPLSSHQCTGIGPHRSNGFISSAMKSPSFSATMLSSDEQHFASAYIPSLLA